MDETGGIDNVTLRLLSSRPPIVKETEERLGVIRQVRPDDIGNLLVHDVKNAVLKDAGYAELTTVVLKDGGVVNDIFPKLSRTCHALSTCWTDPLERLDDTLKALPVLSSQLLDGMTKIRELPEFQSMLHLDDHTDYRYELAIGLQKSFSRLEAFGRILPTFSDEMRFLREPSEESYRVLAAHRVPLKDVAQLVAGNDNLTVPDIELHGGEVVAVYNVLFNAYAHRLPGSDVTVMLHENMLMVSNKSKDSLNKRRGDSLQGIFHIHPDQLQKKPVGGDRIHWGLVISAYMAGLQGGKVDAQEEQISGTSDYDVLVKFDFNRQLVAAKHVQ